MLRTNFPYLLTWLSLFFLLSAVAQGQIPGDEGLYNPAQSVCFNKDSFDNILPDVRILGIGEATHGTKDFLQARHRLSSYLIKNQQFRIILLEAANLRSEGLNDFIQGKDISLDSAFRKLNRWVLTMESVMDMMNWLRAYNMQLPAQERVVIYGIDQDNYQDSGKRFLSAWQQLKGVAISVARISHTLQFDNKASAYGLIQSMKNDEIETIDLFLDSLGLELEHSKTLSNSQEQQQALEEATYHLQNLKGVWKYAKVSKKSYGKGYAEVRDAEMAKNVSFRMRTSHPQAKAIIWAHNEHIQKGEMRLLGMGKYLKDSLGANYFALGMEFGEGSCTWYDQEKKSLVQSFIARPPGQAFQDQACIDFFSGKMSSLPAKLWIHDVPAVKVKAKQTYEKVRPTEHFDGLLFIPKVQASTWVNVYPKQ